MLTFARKHPWLTVLASVGAFFAVTFFVSLFVPYVTDICGKDEYTGQKECAAYHLGPFALLWIIGVINKYNGFVVALGTIAVAVFTWTLWRTSNRQALLARESIDDAKRSSERQLRAYVMVVATADTQIAADAIPQVKIRVKNFGQTPAHDVKADSKPIRQIPFY